MIRFILKQFLYGRFYLWIKSNLGRVFFFAIIIFLIFYFHSEYLKYVDLRENSSNSYIGLSFIVKNLLIIIVTFSYLYFYFFLGKTVKSIEISQEIIKKNDELNRIDSLDFFLNDDEINKKN
jgi:TRAP-type mannitol/chloroaromatic compound transport system permease small subunit